MDAAIQSSPGIVTKVYPYHGYCASLTGVIEFPGKGMRILQNFQKFRVRVRMSYRTSRSSRSSRYSGTGVRKSQKFRAGTKHAVPAPRVLWHGSYRTHRSSGHGYECRTELTEVPDTYV